MQFKSQNSAPQNEQRNWHDRPKPTSTSELENCTVVTEFRKQEPPVLNYLKLLKRRKLLHNKLIRRIIYEHLAGN